MAELNNLLVKGASRFLNKVYFNSDTVFNNISTEGILNVGANTASNALIYLNSKIAIKGKDTWLRINEDKAFADGVYFGSSIVRTDGTLQIGESGKAVSINTSSAIFNIPTSIKSTINVTGQATFGSLSSTNSTIKALTIQDTLTAPTANATFNSLTVRDELRSSKWNIDNITNLGSTFYVAPCIVFTNPSVYINAISGTTVTMIITDDGITSDTIGGATWTNGSKIKLMGRINTTVLGVINGTLGRALNSTTAKTAYLTLNFPNTTLINELSAGSTYSGSSVAELKMMMYEVNKNVNGTTKNRPIGIRMTSYNEDKKSAIDIYNGDVEDGKPVARMGYLNGLPAVNSTNPTGYGFYAAQNAYFGGTLSVTSGKIGGFTISSNNIINGTWGSSGGVIVCTGTESSKSIGGSASVNGWTFASGSTFGVRNNGELYASNAFISGKITATSGKIGGCNIENGILKIADTNLVSINANKITGIVSGAQLGGRNLFLKTDTIFTNNNYCIASYDYANQPLIAGKTYTFTICVTPAPGIDSIKLYFSKGYTALASVTPSGTDKQILFSTFKMNYYDGKTPTDDLSYAQAQLYRFPNDGTVTSATTVHWVKIEEGTGSSAWTPAPEEVTTRSLFDQTASQILGQVDDINGQLGAISILSEEIEQRVSTSEETIQTINQDIIPKIQDNLEQVDTNQKETATSLKLSQDQISSMTTRLGITEGNVSQAVQDSESFKYKFLELGMGENGWDVEHVNTVTTINKEGILISNTETAADVGNSKAGNTTIIKADEFSEYVNDGTQQGYGEQMLLINKEYVYTTRLKAKTGMDVGGALKIIPAEYDGIKAINFISSDGNS
ncbi:hypothetical protein DW128_03215 [Firmicutes bacterium AM10-47]|nr:hypothetical protein DW128_03215 [Firmicutes bacterium AM10-47]